MFSVVGEDLSRKILEIITVGLKINFQGLQHFVICMSVFPQPHISLSLPYERSCQVWGKTGFSLIHKTEICHSIHDIFCIKGIWKGKLEANINKTVAKMLRSDFCRHIELISADQ